MLIKRSETESIKQLKKWTLIYGRRKTGKTFIVENFIEYDDFLFVNRNSTIFSKKLNKIIEFDSLEIILNNIKGTIVIDEFQRLNNSFLDIIQRIPKSGRLILISSTLFMSKRLLDSNSPILGFFAEVKVPIISLIDVLNSIEVKDPALKFELAILLREPIAIEYYDSIKSASQIYSDVIFYSMKTIPSLIGEIFVEEERTLSKTYEGIFRAIASGKKISTKISSFLFSKKLIKKDDPSQVQPYLQILIDLGIIKRIKDVKKNKYYYFHVSPLAELFYYADEKYSIGNRDVSKNEIENIINNRIPFIIENQVREALAKKYDLIENLYQTPQIEVDGILTRLKRYEYVIEVKWKNQITQKELNSIVNKLNQFENVKKIIILKNIPTSIKIGSLNNNIDIWDAKRLIDEIIK